MQDGTTTDMKKGMNVRRLSFCSLFILSLLSFSCTGNHAAEEDGGIKVSSPNENLAVYFQLKKGIPFYRIEKEGLTLFNDSRLGLQGRGMPSFDKNFIIREVKESGSSWLEKQEGLSAIGNPYNSLLIQLEEEQEAGRKIRIIFQVYNDGIRFRYEIPGAEGSTLLQLRDELTEFSLASNFTVLWVPASIEEQHQPAYRRNKISELSEAVQMPLAMEYGDSLFIYIHESPSITYAAASLVNNGNNTFKINRAGETGEGRKMKVEKMPWRTIQIAEKPQDIFTSFLVESLPNPEELKNAFKSVEANDVLQPGRAGKDR